MTTDDNDIKAKFCSRFYCKFCDYGTSKKSSFDTHNDSKRHKYNALTTNDNDFKPKICLKHSCEKCDKQYNDRAGLWRHKKKCNYENEPQAKNEMIFINPPPDELTLKEMFIKVVEQNQAILLENQEMRKLLQETIPKIGNTTNNTTNNNTNNFNLQFFLNEQCKDALNIMDFINQLQLKTSDLDMVGRLGYSEGISKLFIRGLKELDIFKRPIHCSDLKREVIYVKDKDSWEKDSDEKKKMKNAIKYIAAKNFKQIHEWQEENPDSNDYDSKKNTDYNQIVLHSMGGATPEEDENNYNKIIRNVAKESVIDKSIAK
uniref:C2H2-type domain-containing protein n=1 Tax=viral metagenome TaxID=1070528 RepID=A0A6C0HRG9_9ZZZZ